MWFFPSDYTSRPSSRDDSNVGFWVLFGMISILAIIFHLLKREAAKQESVIEIEMENVASSTLRSDLNIQLNNVHFEDESERWLSYVTPSIIRQQQRLLESTSAPSTSYSHQIYLEPIHLPRTRLQEDLPPVYEVPPTYEQCTLKPDWTQHNAAIWDYFETR